MMTARHLALLLAVVAACPAARAGEVVERIVARVNSRIILESELGAALRFQCLVEGRPLESLSVDDRRQMLERLVDRALLDEQIQAAGYERAGQADVARRVQEMRQQLPAGATDESWHAALAKYGLDEEDVAAQAAAQLDVLRFLDLRFRPNISIARRAIEDYYQQQLIPELRRNGAAEVPLREVSDRIRELLVQRRMDELLAGWLRTLRAQAQVVTP